MRGGRAPLGGARSSAGGDARRAADARRDRKLGHRVPRPEAELVERALPVAPARQTVPFGDISIEALPTPHAKIGHYSYLVTWHGMRLYFTGDTDDTTELLAATNLDVAFVSPWLFHAARKSGRAIDAKRVVIYHQEAGETSIPGCAVTCSVPRQGATFRLNR